MEDERLDAFFSGELPVVFFFNNIRSPDSVPSVF